VALTVAEAGRRGGLRLLQDRGRDYFKVIGRKGQEAMRRKHPDMAVAWGKRGGRPRKPALSQYLGGGWEISTRRMRTRPGLSPLPPPIIQRKDT
jgi:hypothetical protein